MTTDPYPDPASPVEVRVGEQPAEVLFRGQAPYTAGVMQLNIRIPADAPTGDRPVTVKVGARASAPIPIQVS